MRILQTIQTTVCFLSMNIKLYALPELIYDYYLQHLWERCRKHRNLSMKIPQLIFQKVCGLALSV